MIVMRGTLHRITATITMVSEIFNRKREEARMSRVIGNGFFCLTVIRAFLFFPIMILDGLHCCAMDEYFTARYKDLLELRDVAKNEIENYYRGYLQVQLQCGTHCEAYYGILVVVFFLFGGW
ncbi:hypothetical protein L873DRAFT_1012509 [Choiromyces venosus 120613-1]|uniref:Uncharacterized protein n=1 Tax=Choiromyces venosus 120613-1 TaxID=1336337 RepID=A0A3N4JK29_9PEZI|nr:hypothetical protein L873DRAFT_1012509 [Choiromyces venosus 120613-1]